LNRQAREARKENSLNFAIHAFFAVIVSMSCKRLRPFEKAIKLSDFPVVGPKQMSHSVMVFPKSLDKPAGLERECHE